WYTTPMPPDPSVPRISYAPMVPPTPMSAVYSLQTATIHQLRPSPLSGGSRTADRVRCQTGAESSVREMQGGHERATQATGRRGVRPTTQQIACIARREPSRVREMQGGHEERRWRPHGRRGAPG